MKVISLDIETYSSVDLAQSGVYRYTESPDFAILLFGYAIDGGPVQVVDLASGEEMPTEVMAALTDRAVTKWAFNAQFERICLSKWLGLPHGRYLDPQSWRCTMVWSAYLGLPLTLEGTGTVLGLEKQKLTEGKDLLRLFSLPRKGPVRSIGLTDSYHEAYCREQHETRTADQTEASHNEPTKDLPAGSKRNRPTHAPEQWARFIAYNRRDVETEMAIQQKLAAFPVPERVWEEYHLDQEINDRGIGLDMDFVSQAIALDRRSRSQLTDRLRELTELANPNSVAQMKQWLSGQGLETATLGKKAVSEMLKKAPEPLAQVLELRQSLAKSSVKKYTAMANVVCADGRARGMFQFYGANRTGRWAGRLIQLQNLPQNHLPDLTQSRQLVAAGNFPALEMLYGSLPEVLSELIRTAFVPKADCQFIVADFSAIEARVIAWLAGESWRQEVFAKGGDIYCASASQMFRVPVEKNGINSHLRQKGKIAELALGYGGSVGALKAMGALEMGLREEELQPLVTAWRAANPRIVRLWWEVDRAALTAVRERTVTAIHVIPANPGAPDKPGAPANQGNHNTPGIRFAYQRGILFITLPSGRRLSYVKPRLGTNPFGSECLTYEGISTTKKWQTIDTYGPKLVENMVQAISRDILSQALLNLRHCHIVAHVHDELVIEADRRLSVEAVCQVMSQTPPWATGLMLNAEGFACDFYQKS